MMSLDESGSGVRQVMSEDEERRAIVNRYTKGREKVLHEIDEWEDPQFELYHVTDRYGFIHSNHLPDKLTEFENKIRNTEATRSSKWIKMIDPAHWEKLSKTDKVRQRIYKGIPNQVRGKAWCLLLGVSAIRSEQEGRYQEMLKFALEHSTDIRQIDLDINRTFRNNVMFKDRYDTKQQELFRILAAYSVYNSEIGYCQGMSQIAALLLMYVHDEEDAFWALDRLMSDDRYAMHGFFIPGFPKLVRFAKHHDLVLKKYLPKVCKHFKKYDIDSTLYTLKWFFQCFLDRVPFSLTLRIWDCFMFDGEIILTCMSYTLLKLHKRSILRKGMEELIPFLQIELEKDFGYHDDEAINALSQSISELRRNKMDVPKEGPSEGERPTKPFGILLHADNLSIMTGDDRSIAGSIILGTQPDQVSLAQTSRASSEMDINSQSAQVEEEKSEGPYDLQRSLSLYDNVDISESLEAASRLSSAGDTIKRDDDVDVVSEIVLKKGVKVQSNGKATSLKSVSIASVESHEANNFNQKVITSSYVMGVEQRPNSVSLPVYHDTIKHAQSPTVLLGASVDTTNGLGEGGDSGLEWPDSRKFRSDEDVKKTSTSVMASPRRERMYHSNHHHHHKHHASYIEERQVRESTRQQTPPPAISPDESSPRSPTALLVRKTSIPKLTPRYTPKGSQKVISPVRSPTSDQAPSLIPRLVTKSSSPEHGSKGSSSNHSVAYQRESQKTFSSGNNVVMSSSTTTSTKEGHNSANYVSVNKDSEKVRIYVPYGSQHQVVETTTSAGDAHKLKLKVSLKESDFGRERSSGPSSAAKAASTLPSVDT